VRNRHTSALVAVIMGIVAAPVFGAEAVPCLMTTAGVTAGAATPHCWVEEQVYVGQLTTGFAAGTRTEGAPAGRFSIPGTARPRGFPAGTYAVFAPRYDGAAAFAFDMDVAPPEGSREPDSVQLETPAHYSVMYDADYHEWGDEPWVEGDSFYQTFVATGPHITRIATQLADKSGDCFHLTLNYSIYEAGEGPPSTWKQISPVRSRFLSGNTDPIIHIFWVPYRSDEVQLTTGKLYALRLWRDPSSQSATFALVARPDRGMAMPVAISSSAIRR
jgi:hypothetical protein